MTDRRPIPKQTGCEAASSSSGVVVSCGSPRRLAGDWRGLRGVAL